MSQTGYVIVSLPLAASLASRDGGGSCRSTIATIAAGFGALEQFKPSLGHVVGASRPRATTRKLSGLAFPLRLRSLLALLLAFAGGYAVGKLAGLHRFQESFDRRGLEGLHDFYGSTVMETN
jgi:hypothetical protein